MGAGRLGAQAVWLGAGANTNWSTSGNWSNTPPNNGTDVIVFTNPSSYTSTVDTNWSINTLTVTGTAGPLVLDNSGGATLTIGGAGGGFFYGGASSVAVNVPIAGTGNFWLNGGTGTVTLNPGAGSNTFSGSTEVFGGATLADGEANSFSANSVLYPGGTGGGTVLVNFNETVAGLNDGGANGLVKIASGMTLTLTGAFTTTYSGVIADNGGPGGLTMNGPSTLTLKGANTYTGPTVINSGGGINIGGGTATGSIVSNVSGAGALGFDRSNAYTYSGTLSGGLNVVQSGAGTTTLSGINTYTGPTTITAGTLQAGSTSAFGNSADTLIINGSGTLALNGFSNTIDSVQSFSTNSTIALTGGATLTLGDTGASTTFEGLISDTGSLNSSSFSLNITGNGNTYSGGTTISSGTLIANNPSGGSATGTGPITILPGAALLFGQANTNGYISPGSAITDNGALQFFRTDVTPNVVANNISGTGGVAQNGTGITELSGTNTYSGTTTVFQGTLEAGSTSAFGGAAGLSQISFTFDGALNLNGFNNTVGSITGGASGGTISLGAANLTLAASNVVSPFTGTISGTGGLILTGVNAITTLSGANTYSGGTTITSGFLIADNPAGSATGTGPITINSGAILEVGNSDTSGSVAAAAITDNGIIELARSDSTTLASNISGSGGLSLLATGTVTLSGNNSYSGPTFIVGGDIAAGSNTALGNGLSAVQFVAGGTLSLGSFDATVGSIEGDPTTFINLGSGELITGAANTTTTFSGVISGPGILEIVGTGETILDGANTFTGGITIPGTGGRLSIGDGFTPGASIVSNVVDEGTLTFAPASSDNLTYPGVISGIGSVNFSGAGTIALSGANVYSGPTTISSGTVADAAPNAFSPNSSVTISSSGALAVNFNETVADLENGSGGGPIALASGATLTIGTGNNALPPFQGAISGPGALVINTNLDSNLSQGLAGANTYSGGTTVLNGELFVGSNTAVGTGTITFDAGTELSPWANVTLANPIVLSGGEALDNDDGGGNNLTLTGQISEVAGSGSIVWCTPGTLALTNANTFTGGVDMREGTLLLGNDSAAGTGTITLDSDTVLSALGSGVTRNLANDINVTGSPAQIGNSDNNFITISGSISGEASLVYEGGTNGTLTLTGGNNGFSGPFTINSGTVIAGNNSAFGSSGNTVTLNGGAGLNVMNGITVNNPLVTANTANVISGNGTIGSPVTVDGTVVLSPSASPGGGPGNLTFSSTLTLATGGAIHFDIYDATGAAGTGYSLITAGGGLDLTAAPNTLTFNIVSVNAAGNPAAAINFNPTITYSWTFANSTSAISGFGANQFNLVTSGFANGTAGGAFSVSESGNSLELNFTPVPEPTTWTMMGAGLLAAAPLALRRRRSKS